MATARIVATESICAEPSVNLPQLDHFILRDKGRAIAIEKITKILDPNTIEVEAFYVSQVFYQGISLAFDRGGKMKCKHNFDRCWTEKEVIIFFFSKRKKFFYICRKKKKK